MKLIPRANATVRPTGHLSPRRDKITTPFIYNATAVIKTPIINASGSYSEIKRHRFGGGGVAMPAIAKPGSKISLSARNGGAIFDRREPTSTATSMMLTSTINRRLRFLIVICNLPDKCLRFRYPK